MLCFYLAAGCARQEERVTVGVIDRDRIMREPSVAGALQSLDKKIADLEAELRDKKVEAQDELQEREEKTAAAIREEWLAAVKKREETLNKELEEKHKDFFAEKDKQMQDFIQAAESEINSKLSLLAQQAQSPLTTEAQLRELERQAAQLRGLGEERVKAKDDEIRQEVEQKIAGDVQVLRRELDDYAAGLKERLQEKQREEMREFAENLLGEEQKRQNEFAAERELLTHNIAERLEAAVMAVAGEKQLTVVLGSFAVNIGALDITEEVLTRLKARAAGASGPADKTEDKTAPAENRAAVGETEKTNAAEPKEKAADEQGQK
jgi:Skp family chaperone for outer membrane proteins